MFFICYVLRNIVKLYEDNGIDLKVKVVWVINYKLYSRLGMCV